MKYSVLFTLFVSLFVFCVCEKSVDTTADLEAMKKITIEWDKAVQGGDFDALLALYVDNPVRMHPNEPKLVGKQTIRANFEKYRQENDAIFTNTTTDAIISGDYAFAWGTYTGDYTPKANPETIHDEGKWVSLRQRQSDGSWKIVLDIYNSDLPCVSADD